MGHPIQQAQGSARGNMEYLDLLIDAAFERLNGIWKKAERSVLL
jgi:hypothetical protein